MASHHRRKLKSRHGWLPQCKWEIRAQFPRSDAGLKRDGGHFVVDVRFAHSSASYTPPAGLTYQIEQ